MKFQKASKAVDPWSVVALLFFLVLLVVGILIFRDYGVSWDEPVQHNLGKINLRYALGRSDELLTFKDRFYGPVFEVGLYGAERIFRVTDSQAIYFLRHLLTFLTFYAGVVYFFFLARNLFQITWLALLGTVMLVLSPRIFEHAFYNSKDIPFLTFFTASCLTLFLYMDSRSTRWLLVHALTSALLVATRVLGILIPAFTLIVLLVGIFQQGQDRKAAARRALSHAGLYVVATCLLTVLFWPVLWNNPLGNFRTALIQMGRYTIWRGTNLFLGERILASELPWTYIPIWILVTTPWLYSALFFAGVLTVLTDLIKRPREIVETGQLKKLVILIWFFAPILSIIILRSVLYDSWRHLFFVYPAFLLLALWGLLAIWTWVDQKKGSFPFFRVGLGALLVLFLLFTVRAMVFLHPYEQMYFNRLPGQDLQTIQTTMDMDYWGLSYRKGLEYIVQNDPSAQISVAVENRPGQWNALILPVAERDRLVYVQNREDASYFLTNYRSRLSYPYSNEVFSVVVDGAKLLSVFRLDHSQ